MEVKRMKILSTSKRTRASPVSAVEGKKISDINEIAGLMMEMCLLL